MRIEEDMKLDYKDVLIRPKRSTLGSRKDVDLERGFTFRNYKGPRPMHRHYRGTPIMASNMDGVGTFEQADTLADMNMFTCLVKTYSVEELAAYFNTGSDRFKRTSHVAVSVGITERDEKKFSDVYAQIGENLKYVCIDVANGYSERFVDYVKRFRETYPDIIIIAGNVVTADMTQELILNGADIVKVGIGPGSVCTTRIKTGVGYPQLSAVIECADAAHGLGGHIIADGGCTNSGDVAKAFGAGADFVMLGGMLAGHDEGGSEEVTKHYASGEYTKINNKYYIPHFEEKYFVKFYGMSSETANEKHFGGLKDYRAAEGKEVTIPYRGSVADTVQDILGGIRSACTYVGASKIKDLTKCTTFVKVNNTHNKVFENGS